MLLSSNTFPVRFISRRSGFSLIEVVLAIGIFLVTVLALVGLLGPTLKSVDEVEKTDEIASVVNTINAFLQSSPDINPTGSKFNAVYNAVASGDFATIFVFREFVDDDDPTAIDLRVGFIGDEVVSPETLGNAAKIANDATAFENAAGNIFRAILTASSVTPDDHTSDNGTGEFPRYKLTKSLAGPTPYPEGYFAIEVRIYPEDPGPTFDPGRQIDTLVDVDPAFTYNTAVVR